MIRLKKKPAILTEKCFPIPHSLENISKPDITLVIYSLNDQPYEILLFVSFIFILNNLEFQIPKKAERTRF
jgi:hypothetical protein